MNLATKIVDDYVQDGDTPIQIARYRKCSIEDVLDVLRAAGYSDVWPGSVSPEACGREDRRLYLQSLSEDDLLAEVTTSELKEMLYDPDSQQLFRFIQFALARREQTAW